MSVATALYWVCFCCGPSPIPPVWHVRKRLCRLLPGPRPLLRLGWHLLLSVLPNRHTCETVRPLFPGTFPLFRKQPNTILFCHFLYPFRENNLLFFFKWFSIYSKVTWFFVFILRCRWFNNVVFVLGVQQLDSGIHRYIPSFSDSFPIEAITEYWGEFPVL